MHPMFWFMFVPLAVVIGIIFLLTRMFSGIFSRREPEERVDETRMIQEIYHNLNRLEDRMDVLETLLMESDKKEKE